MTIGTQLFSMLRTKFHANAVSLNFPFVQSGSDASNPQRAAMTPSPGRLEMLTELAQRYGLAVQYRPYLWENNLAMQSRPSITPANVACGSRTTGRSSSPTSCRPTSPARRASASPSSSRRCCRTSLTGSGSWRRRRPSTTGRSSTPSSTCPRPRSRSPSAATTPTSRCAREPEAGLGRVVHQGLHRQPPARRVPVALVKGVQSGGMQSTPSDLTIEELGIPAVAGAYLVPNYFHYHRGHARRPARPDGLVRWRVQRVPGAAPAGDLLLVDRLQHVHARGEQLHEHLQLARHALVGSDRVVLREDAVTLRPRRGATARARAAARPRGHGGPRRRRARVGRTVRRVGAPVGARRGCGRGARRVGPRAAASSRPAGTRRRSRARRAPSAPPSTSAGDVVLDEPAAGRPPCTSTPSPLVSVSCTSSTFCVAVDRAGRGLVYDGTSWVRTTIDTFELTSVSCAPGTSFCVAVDVDGDAFTYAASTWSARAPVAVLPFSAVSCATTTFCVAVDGAGDAYTFTGTWSPSHAVARRATALLSVACPASAFCVAGNDAGGSTPLSAGTGARRLACSVPACRRSAARRPPRASPSATPPPPRSRTARRGPRRRASSPAATASRSSARRPAACTALSAAGETATFSGVLERAVDGRPAPGNLTGVACGAIERSASPSTTPGMSSRWNGTSGPPRVPDRARVAERRLVRRDVLHGGQRRTGRRRLLSRRVGPRRRCRLERPDGRLVHVIDLLRGGRRVEPRAHLQRRDVVRPEHRGRRLVDVRGYNAVACMRAEVLRRGRRERQRAVLRQRQDRAPPGRHADAPVCIVSHYPGRPHDCSTSTPLTGVACASSALCVAVDEEGKAMVVTTSGTQHRWCKPGHIDAYRLTGVSCTHAGFCLAVDDGGGTVVYDHGRWPATRAVPLGRLMARSRARGPRRVRPTDASAAAVGNALSDQPPRARCAAATSSSSIASNRGAASRTE